MKESILIKFLYRTILGRIILKILVNPFVSKVSARFLSSSFSGWLVPWFIKKNGIDMTYYQVPEKGFSSFNDFFTRKIKNKYIEKSNNELMCPCDGLLTVAEINKDAVFHIKHTSYNLREMLRSKQLADEFEGGTAFIFRLTPAHYHRYLWAASGKLKYMKHINGVLHSVQPVCHEKTKVFIQNTREYAVVSNAVIGNIIQMEVGALLVGKISNRRVYRNQVVKGGGEKGFFEYGGSTIVLLIKGKAELADNIKDRYVLGAEIPVIIGEQLIK